MTTIGEWMAARTPCPPDALRVRIEHLLGDALSRDVSEAPAHLLSAGETLAESLLRSGSTTRETALDLLAVDALVTYAFEAAGEDPQRLDERAADAMSRISALADVPA